MSKNRKNKPEAAGSKSSCGVVMPIGPTEGYPANHWREVRDIIFQSIEIDNRHNLDVSMVSDSDQDEVIHSRIVTKIYDSDLVVCDLSSRNPNVMLELGMRLAFGKPVVLIKDRKTKFDFDSGVIEHLEYDCDLRYANVQVFKKQLGEKINNVCDAVKSGAYRSFLSSFGSLKAIDIPKDLSTPQDVMFSMLNDISRQLQVISASQRNLHVPTVGGLLSVGSGPHIISSTGVSSSSSFASANGLPIPLGLPPSKDADGNMSARLTGVGQLQATVFAGTNDHVLMPKSEQERRFIQQVYSKLQRSRAINESGTMSKSDLASFVAEGEEVFRLSHERSKELVERMSEKLFSGSGGA